MPRLAPVLLSLLVLAGCGGGGDEPDRLMAQESPSAEAAKPRVERGGRPRGGSEPRRTGPVTRAEKAVIRGWADALRRGDVERAVSYWSVPALAANGGQPFRLLSRSAVRFFNEGLTCGAELESTARDANYVLATFRLTERPGEGRCGSGVGEQARTLFLLRGGKIVQWLRATDPRSPADTPGGTTS